MTWFVAPEGAAYYDTNTGMPGCAPISSQMTGNPNPPADTPDFPPAPQNSAAAPLTTQMSNGNIPVQSKTTVAGADSLLAQLSRGAVIQADSTYGQSILAGAAPPPVVTGPSSGVSFSGYSGD